SPLTSQTRRLMGKRRCTACLGRFVFRLGEHRLQIIHERLAAAVWLRVRRRCFLARMIEHHARESIERRAELATCDFGHWLAELCRLGSNLGIEWEDDVDRPLD